MAENALTQSPLASRYIFRPALIVPPPDTRGWWWPAGLLELLFKLAPGTGLSAADLGRAMVNVTITGNAPEIVENSVIRRCVCLARLWCVAGARALPISIGAVMSHEKPNDPAATLASLVRTHGIILGTERYDACLSFYRDTLGLPVWFEKEGLCCLRFGDGYLMIETGGMARDTRKPNSENPTMLRFNVDDVSAAADLLEAKGVSVERKQFSWGQVGTFLDPDGNACELKDAGDPFFSNEESQRKPRGRAEAGT